MLDRQSAMARVAQRPAGDVEADRAVPVVAERKPSCLAPGLDLPERLAVAGDGERDPALRNRCGRRDCKQEERGTGADADALNEAAHGRIVGTGEEGSRTWP